MAKSSPAESPNPEIEERDDAVIGTALVVSGAVLVLLLVAGACFAWWYWRAKPAPLLVDRPLELPTQVNAPQVTIPAMPFADITRQAGIDFQHENGGQGEKLLPETMGSGCAFLDYDNDGDQDLLFVNSCAWSDVKNDDKPPATLALYQNDGSGQFRNVTQETGLSVSFYGMGVATGDYDGDGRTDIFISAVGKSRLFHNTDNGFEEVADAAGVAGQDSDWGTSCGWFDYDRDGDLDLFVCQYVEWSRAFDLAQNFQLIGGGRAYGRPQQFGGTFSRLYQNQGNGRFQDVSKVAGVQIANADTRVAVGKSLGVAFADFDHDGWLDIVVANDTVANFLFHNQQDGTFKEVGYIAGIAYDTNGLARGAMGIDIAHFRNNREVGIAIGNFANEMTALYVAPGKQLQFRDDAVANGLGPATRLELTFGLLFADVDLDGRLDLFATNGHLEEDINRVQRTQFYAQPAHFFWNCGAEHATEFLPVPKEKCGEALLQPIVGRGAAYADIDNDGDLDLVVSASGGTPRLLRNDQNLGQNWLRVKLHGNGLNREAIGATVELHQQGVVQRRLVSPTRSYLSQCELPVTFGLGQNPKIDKLVVLWPSGRREEKLDFTSNQTLTLNEPASTEAPTP